MGDINLLSHGAGHLTLSPGSELGPEFFDEMEKILDFFIWFILLYMLLHLRERGQPLKRSAFG